MATAPHSANPPGGGRMTARTEARGRQPQMVGHRMGEIPLPALPDGPSPWEGGQWRRTRHVPPVLKRARRLIGERQSSPGDPSGASLTPLTDTLTDSRWTALLEVSGLGSGQAAKARPES